ncbi:hypothetical protein CYMTET_48280 [Cymbomonas tetramitiformis]|uniref:Uncharacterized protein n=1 Tax=Cymbomonas tetramitiformis TaxID=36881 RepID=A0AAE0BU69_9CHLO|nr:hypothetical protein CYMTET_48280 [Cymbomonas tetramitiformis]
MGCGPSQAVEEGGQHHQEQVSGAEGDQRKLQNGEGGEKITDPTVDWVPAEARPSLAPESPADTTWPRKPEESVNVDVCGEEEEWENREAEEWAYREAEEREKREEREERDDPEEDQEANLSYVGAHSEVQVVQPTETVLKDWPNGRSSTEVKVQAWLDAHVAHQAGQEHVRRESDSGLIVDMGCTAASVAASRTLPLEVRTAPEAKPHPSHASAATAAYSLYASEPPQGEARPGGGSGVSQPELRNAEQLLGRYPMVQGPLVMGVPGAGRGVPDPVLSLGAPAKSTSHLPGRASASSRSGARRDLNGERSRHAWWPFCVAERGAVVTGNSPVIFVQFIHTATIGRRAAEVHQKAEEFVTISTMRNTW